MSFQPAPTHSVSEVNFTSYADVRIEFGLSFDAKNKKEAIEFLKDSFKDDYGIDLMEDEIINLEEVK